MMKTKYSLSVLAVLAAFGFSTANATTTLQFSQTGVARATGFADHNGVATDGMRWGVLIDTSGNGFQAGSYESFDNSMSGFLTVGGVATDDYFFTPSALPVTSTLTATGTDPGGVGGIVSAVAVPNGTDGVIPGVSTNDPFAIMHFETTPTGPGTYYGVFENGAFLLPASGSSVSFASVFSGAVADPLKIAGHQFQPIPEPSRMMLLGLGLIGLVFRRRR